MARPTRPMEKQLKSMLQAQAIGALIAIPFLFWIGYKIITAMILG